MSLPPNEFQAKMLPLAKKFTDAFRDNPTPDDPEQGRMIVIAALNEVCGAVIAQTVAPELTLGVAWRHLQVATEKFVRREVEPACPCPRCTAEREGKAFVEDGPTTPQ